ncbi:MAG: metallophosphoesterase, partial [Bacteroidetes bacterium]
NHDYGEYFRWENEEDKLANIESLKNRQKNMGFKLLLNESKVIEQDEEQITIVGVENWGNPPFPQYGSLEKALDNVQNIPFKLLLSHDPTHFDMKVAGKEDIAITFSGHTHGMQFAINFGGINWSPIKWKYPKWRGLYQHGEHEQYLYVNIGLGYIGFPGRIGTDPEITVIELKNS